MDIKNITPEAESFVAAFTDSRDYVAVHTSGSTGTPKLIRLLKSDMIRSAEASCTFLASRRHRDLFALFPQTILQEK